MEKSSSGNSIKHYNNCKFKVAMEGMLVGLLTGIIIVAYRLLLNQVSEFRETVLLFLKSNSRVYTLGWFIILAGVGLTLGLLIEKIPMIKGSGIPQVKGVFLRQLKMDWLKELLAKFFGGIIAPGLGLSLGREGPSIQLGSQVGLGVSRILKRHQTEEKYLITSGATAGLAAAFNAPLAGVVFSLEELHKNFTPLILVSTMGASLVANFVSTKFFGLKPAFKFAEVTPLPINQYLYLIPLGIIIAIAGGFFNYSLLKIQDIYGNLTGVKDRYKPIIPFLLAGILGLFMPDMLGGGHELVEKLGQQQFLITTLLLFIVIKFLFTIVCYGSGVPGGIFLPLLVIGALMGKVYGLILVDYFGLSTNYVINFVILAMAAYFTAITKAPITGSILILEMTNSFNNFLELMVVVALAYLVVDLLEVKPIYDSLLEKILHKKGKKDITGDGNKKIIMEIPISPGSELECKQIKEVLWPEGCLIVGINRLDNEIIPKGETKILEGDRLIILSSEEVACKVKCKLLSMGEENAENTQLI